MEPTTVHPKDLRFAWFGGILEGPVGDPAPLVLTVQAINALGSMHADLEVDRGRFSVVFDSATVPGKRFVAGHPSRLVELLQDLVAACPDPERIESTLHCTEIYDDQAVETLFAMQSGQIEAVSRARSIQPSDRGRQGNAEHAASLRLPNMNTRTWVLLVSLFVLAGGLMAWRTGIARRFLAAQSETLQVESALFQDLLQVEVQGEWGNYVARISRGPRYPKDRAEAEALTQATQSNAEAAAVQAVAGGGRLFVQLLNKDGKVLEAQVVELASLLTKETPQQTELRGRPDAKALRLALDSGLENP